MTYFEDYLIDMKLPLVGYRWSRDVRSEVEHYSVVQRSRETFRDVRKHLEWVRVCMILRVTKILASSRNPTPNLISILICDVALRTSPAA
jgi:hypothetical protein